MRSSHDVFLKTEIIRKGLLLIRGVILHDDTMKGIKSLLILMIFFSVMVIPVSSESDEHSLLIGVQNLSVAVPPTPTAILGSKEHMYQYQAWLEECSYNIMGYSNQVLIVFGQNPMDWWKQIPSSSSSPVSIVQPVTIAPAVITPTGTPTLGIPPSSELMPIGYISGGTGKKSAIIVIPCSYWELWYTADPYIMGGQDLGKARGANSQLFPTLSMKITDLRSPDSVEIVEPPGGLDITLWQRSYDPRPWTQKYYRGNRMYRFDITAEDVKSYVIEVRIRKADFPNDSFANHV